MTRKATFLDRYERRRKKRQQQPTEWSKVSLKLKLEAESKPGPKIEVK